MTIIAEFIKCPLCNIEKECSMLKEKNDYTKEENYLCLNCGYGIILNANWNPKDPPSKFHKEVIFKKYGFTSYMNPTKLTLENYYEIIPKEGITHLLWEAYIYVNEKDEPQKIDKHFSFFIHKQEEKIKIIKKLVCTAGQFKIAREYCEKIFNVKVINQN